MKTVRRKKEGFPEIIGMTQNCPLAPATSGLGIWRKSVGFTCFVENLFHCKFTFFLGVCVAFFVVVARLAFSPSNQAKAMNLYIPVVKKECADPSQDVD